MRKSFTVTFERVDPETGGFDGLALLMNAATSTSGARVAVTDVRAYFPTGFTSDQTNLLGNGGIVSLDRITASSGGAAVAAIEHDTDAASLPAQVSFVTFPTSVTSTATLRRVSDVFSMGLTQSISFQAQYRAPGVCDSNDHSGRTAEGQDIWHADGVPETEPIVLNEGEGVATIKRAYGVPRAHTWTVTVRVSGTGASYRYIIHDCGDPGTIGDAYWSLMNGSGSGVVLQVYVVTMPDLGESNIPRFRLARVVGRSTDDGASVTPVAHDTSNALPELAAYKGDFRPALQAQGISTNYWNYQGTPVTIAEQQRIGLLRNFMIGKIVTETAPPNLMMYGADEIWPGDKRAQGTLVDDSLWLNPGEGLAVIAGGQGLIEASEGAYVNIEMTGYVETTSINQPRARYALGV